MNCKENTPKTGTESQKLFQTVTITDVSVVIPVVPAPGHIDRMEIDPAYIQIYNTKNLHVFYITQRTQEHTMKLPRSLGYPL